MSLASMDENHGYGSMTNYSLTLPPNYQVTNNIHMFVKLFFFLPCFPPIHKRRYAKREQICKGADLL